MCLPAIGAGSADDSAAAEALFQDGKALMAQKQPALACPKFEASFKLDEKLGTLLNLADCFEAAGKTGSAWHRFDEAVALAERDKDERADYAKKRRDTLATSITKVRIDVVARGEEAKALVVLRDGVPLDEAAIGAGVVVDPGPVTVEVRRDDEPIDKRTISARPGQQEVVSLDLDAIAKAHPEVRVRTAKAKAQRAAGFTIGGIGLAGLTVFAILEGVAAQKSSAADAQGSCKNGFCTPQGYAAKGRAGDIAEAGQWVGVASGAVTAVGLTLWLTAPKGKTQKLAPQVSFAPYASPTGVGLVVGGHL